MAVQLQQALAVGTYIVTQRLKGRKRFPLVLMLEPLFRCNLACSGCGKIQHPKEILKQNLSPQDCFKAVEECGAPVVSIPGGEPLLHPQIDEIVQGLVQRKKFVYLCTNAILLEKSLDKFKPSPYLTFSVHLDGLREHHDKCVDRQGVFDIAVKAIKAAKAKGFRVTTNTTVFEGADPQEMQKFFDFLGSLETDGMMISPGYSYEWAPDQDHFLKREQTKALFREILAPWKSGKKSWNFNHNPLFLDFLMGEKDYDCTPWGSPSYSVLGWQKPCYLLNEGHYKTYQELLEKTDWEQYGRKSNNPKCADCMVHCGYEPTAAMDALKPENMGRAMGSLLKAS
ncbi:hopanoid biosynthesis associated radical SAM protein HpnH [Gloeothece citriformis PCC 7424]|uniref:Hopanoid biosynthesis associated radical SAM protein HpnH n=1 Tax=Gloeothece citriformis (strain PCC 7424) TaxID=65393 RepID=B7KFD5_GLOC7|nr:adenosyl-hopene transferase HpnH [Gloeothece citriformis]ACK71851.1 hopanoid biosynthesis associated radical SAM protein HpnH [Gloeothece citriformis PCC 7424]